MRRLLILLLRRLLGEEGAEPGEGWDVVRRCWTGTRNAEEFGALAETWFRAGAQIVRGCCRTGPEYVWAVARASRVLRGSGELRA